MLLFGATAFGLFASTAFSKIVTIRNDVPRVDVNGEIMDSHSQCIVYAKNQFFLYGEHYGNATGMDWQWTGAPKVGVYTSPDMVSWTWQGLILPGWNHTEWVPSVIYDESRDRFVAWFGSGWWGVAESSDGIHFELLGNDIPSRFGRTHRTDGNALFVDEDSTGYVIFSDYNPAEPILDSHQVSIEKLTPDYLNTTHENVTGYFPDSFVEGAVLFRRNGTYYAAYGQCCCACRAGSGFVVFRAPSVSGPWVRQDDMNCQKQNTPFCKEDFTVPGQGFGVSLLPTRNGTVYLWTANRWLQGPNNPQKCPNLCERPATPECTDSPSYRVGKDPTYWAPIEFAQDGSILPFRFMNSFTLDL